MISIFSVLAILALSIFVTRVATVALVQTGLSRESARFQARSAFTGVGFTTSEAERVVNHPVRRRIVMLLMLLGNAGIVSVIASFILGLATESSHSLAVRLGVLGTGVAILWLLAVSPLVDRFVSAAIGWALHRWTRLEARDFASLLELRGGYRVREFEVGDDDWLADRRIAETDLREEGIEILGIRRGDGSYIGVPQATTRIERDDVLIVYGHADGIDRLVRRRRGAEGDREHAEAVRDQAEAARRQRADDERREGGNP